MTRILSTGFVLHLLHMDSEVQELAEMNVGVFRVVAFFIPSYQDASQAGRSGPLAFKHSETLLCTVFLSLLQFLRQEVGC